MNSKVKQYQSTLREKLKVIFRANEVKSEWQATLTSFNVYSPRIDIAVGPFAEHRDCIIEYNSLLEQYRLFFLGLIELHNSNMISLYGDYFIRTLDNLLSTNNNSRCFLSIEIENSTSRKHILGGAINASSLGRVGLIIPFNKEKFLAIKKLEGYFNFLQNAGKNSFNANNLLIINKEQLDIYLHHFINKQG